MLTLLGYKDWEHRAVGIGFCLIAGNVGWIGRGMITQWGLSAFWEGPAILMVVMFLELYGFAGIMWWLA